jgi:hypothetical protein
LARRDDVWRVSRLDLTNRRASDLGVLAFDHCANEFDGTGWTIAINRSIRVIDVNRSLQSVLWHVADLPGNVVAMTATATLEQFVVAEPDGLSLWRYQLPQRRLLDRATLVEQASATGSRDDDFIVMPEGGITSVWLDGDVAQPTTLCYTVGSHICKVALATQMPGRFICLPGKNWLLAGIENGDTGQLDLQLVLIHSARPGATVSWPADSGLTKRSVGDRWLLFDRQGRLLDIDVGTGEVLNISLQ